MANNMYTKDILNFLPLNVNIFITNLFSFDT